VLLQECVKDDQVTTFLGHVGLWNVVLLIPLLILQWEEFPTSGRVWLAVGVNALMGTFVAQYVWSLAVLRTSPVMVTLGLALSIPLALLGDMLLKGMPLSIEYVAGAALVVLGFLCIHYQS
jgi:solute carrier family 35 protein F5